MVDDSQLLMLPLELCRNVRLIGGSAMTTKMMMVLEAARQPRQAEVVMPMAQLADAIGSRTEYVRGAVERLADVRCSVLAHDGAWEMFDVLDPAHSVVGRGRGATVTVRTTAGWRMSCDHGRTVPFPADEVRAMTTRTGLLMRLRAGAALHGRTVPSDPRLRIRTADFPHYTGYDGAGGPSTLLTQLIFPGVDDVNLHSSTLEVRVRTANRSGPGSQTWCRHMDLRITPIRTREVVHAA